MRGERTKRRIPARVFLSDRMALSKAADGTRAKAVRAQRRISATIRENRRRASSPVRGRKSGGDHAPSYGFAVLIAAVIRDTFEGMGESVTVIENSRMPDSCSSRLTTRA